MKKIVLLLCALIGISVGMAAGPVEQSPAKRLIAKQTKPATELQTPPANVTLRKGDAQLQLAKPGAKAIAPVKAKRTKAPARADETTTEPLLVVVTAESNIPETIMHDVEFTVDATIRNDGADFDGIIYMQINDGQYYYYMSDPQEYSIPNGGTAKVTITGTVTSAMISPGYYYLDLIWENETTGDFITTEEGSYMYVTVEANPETAYVLSMTKAEIPATINQNEDGTLPVTIANTGGGNFNSAVTIVLVDPTTGEMAGYTDLVPANIPAGGEQEVNLTYNFPGAVYEAGTYMLSICYLEGTTLYDIPLPDGSNYKEIEIVETAGPELSLNEASVFPETIVQGVEFTVQASISNTGADFTTETLGLVMTDPYTGNVIWTDGLDDAASIANGISQDFTLTGAISEDVPVGQYYLYVSYLAGGYYIFIGRAVVTVSPNPETTPILSWETAEMPETICQNQDFTVSGTISNTGADFTGQVGIALVQQDPWSGQSYIMYESDYQNVTVAKDGSYGFTATCNVGDLATGEYYLYVGYDDGEYFNAISGGNAVTVSLNPDEGPVLSLVEAESSIPEAIAQNTEFTITAVVRNDGQTFNGSITLQIADFSNPYYTDTKAVSIANGESQTLTFTGTLDAAEVPASDYYLDILWEDEEGNFDYLYNTYVTVEADPTLPILQIVETEELNADSYLVFLQNTDVPFSILVENTGGSTYEGEVFMAFVDYFENILFRTEAVNATIPAGEQQTLDFVINVGNMDTGLYDMALMYNENTIANMSDSYYSTFFVEVSDPTSISDTGAATFTVGPNPAADHVDVACGEGIQSVRIYSLSGSLLMQEEAEGTTCRLDISALPQGAYLLNIVTADGATKTERLIKR